MSPRLLGTCVLAAPFVSACAFLIDFNELQKGNLSTSKDAGNSGGSAGASGGAAGTGGGAEAGLTGGAGGAAGDASASDASGCSASCDDKDPCTVDSCSSGACTHTRVPGVVPDGLSAKAIAKTFHRVTIAAHKDTFYLSALKTTATGTDVLLHSFGTRETLLPLGRNLSNLVTLNGGTPVSAAGIAAGESDAVIKLFVAVGQTIGQAAQVWEITADASFAIQSAVPAAADDDYGGSATTYPIAWAPSGSEVFAAWPGPSTGVFMHKAGNPAEAAGTPPIFAGAIKVTSLAPLGAGSVPGVLYIGGQAYVQAVGQSVPLPLGACDTQQGARTSAVSAFTQITDVWLGGWTKTLASGGTVAELKPILCASGSSGVGCAGSLKCQAGDTTLPGVRNPAVVFVTAIGDPAGRVYELLAAPYVNTSKNQAGIGLQMTQIDINTSSPDGGQKATPITATPIPLVTTAPGANDAGPDWPAMAFMAPDRLAVAWIQPGALAGEEELHVERHRVCFPKK